MERVQAGIMVRTCKRIDWADFYVDRTGMGLQMAELDVERAGNGLERAKMSKDRNGATEGRPGHR